MSKTLETRSQLADEALGLMEKAAAGDADARARLVDINAELKALDAHLVGQVNDAMSGGAGFGHAAKAAPTLGDHFVKSVGDQLGDLRSKKGFTVSAPEFKAATDTIAVGTGGDLTPLLTDYDRTIVKPKRQRPVIADLLGTGTVSGNAVTYFVEGAEYGDFATVAEGALKPQMSFDPPTEVTDKVKKIAGWIKVTDEFLEDLPFLKTEIDNRLMHKLAMFEEAQLFRGDGVGTNILGILNRTGVQLVTATSADDLADAIFRAMTKISTATDLTATGVIINPLDYQALKLQRDGNGQYYGGGFFTGPYGNGGYTAFQPIWGLTPVVSPVAEAGKPVVGAFDLATTVYRKGGIQLAATSSHEDDFTNNKVTIRAEERIALAVRVPAAIVKVETAVGP